MSFLSYVAHAALASLMAGRNYTGIVQNNEDAVVITKGLNGLGADDKDDNADKDDTQDIQE